MDEIDIELQYQAISDRNEEVDKTNRLKKLEADISVLRKTMDEKDEEISELTMRKTQLSMTVNEMKDISHSSSNARRNKTELDSILMADIQEDD